MMNDKAMGTLRTIILDYGRQLCDDSRRCEAFLRDLCGDCPREIAVLVMAQKENVATDLRSATAASLDVLCARLVLRLEDNCALTNEAARWAVKAWAYATGLVGSDYEIVAPAWSRGSATNYQTTMATYVPLHTPPVTPRHTFGRRLLLVGTGSVLATGLVGGVALIRRSAVAVSNEPRGTTVPVGTGVASTPTGQPSPVSTSLLAVKLDGATTTPATSAMDNAPTAAPLPTYTPIPPPMPLLKPTQYPTSTPYPKMRTPTPLPTYTPVPPPPPPPTSTPYPTPTSYPVAKSSQSAALSPSSQATTIWHDSLGRISFAYPRNWRTVPTDPSSNEVFEVDSGDGVHVSLYVSRSTQTPLAGVSYYRDHQQEQHLDRTYVFDQIVSSSLGGLPAVYMAFTSTNARDPRDVHTAEVAYASSDSWLFGFEYYTDGPQWRRHDEVAGILRSVIFGH